MTKIPEWRRFKVIQIHWVWTHTAADALKAARESDFFLDVEFAKDETPRSFLSTLKEQILG